MAKKERIDASVTRMAGQIQDDWAKAMTILMLTFTGLDALITVAEGGRAGGSGWAAIKSQIEEQRKAYRDLMGDPR